MSVIDGLYYDVLDEMDRYEAYFTYLQINISLICVAQARLGI